MMDPAMAELLGAIGAPAAAAAGAAWMSVKLSLNGLKTAVKRIEDAVEKTNSRVQSNAEHVARLDGRLSALERE